MNSQYESNKKKFCPTCGEKIPKSADFCSFCGNEAEKDQSSLQHGDVNEVGYRSNYPPKDKTVAGILAIILGTFGAHKFYIDNNRKGFLYFLFFWTGIPTIIGFVEGILYFTDNDEIFQKRVENPYNFPKDPSRDRIFAGITAIIFGFIGGHHFFLRDGKGFLYALFSFTGIPFIIGFVEGIIYLTESTENFEYRYGF